MTQYFEPIPYSLWHSDKAAFAEALGRSFRETGFAVITGHPVQQAHQPLVQEHPHAGSDH